ncbi:MAG: DNA mismatch repair endonuclease MutL [Cyanobacteriota bacterium]|nr:DNA mismatch repair endonuclease MutL [Cyanobacteriota bacterium]
MSAPIQFLPTEVVHLIAAGETIDSIAAVVRELVDNAIDAGATRIAISVWPSLWRVQVADNGTGTTRENLQHAASAHSTSKIHHSGDLDRITSLGFRGEALHSLAQLADLEMFSRTRDGDGWRAIYDRQGKPHRVERVAIAPGTIVSVSNLFERWPARRQALPSASQQLRAIQQFIGQMALCHPHITWQIRRDDRPWFGISPGETSREILPQITRNVRPEDLQHLRVEVPSNSDSEAIPTHPSIELAIGLPDRCHRRRLDWVKVALNGRIVQIPDLESTIVSAFARTLPRDRYPLCFAHLRVAPEEIDWNRHPAKTEIYLHRVDEWQQRLNEAIDRALRLSPTHAPAASKQRVSQLIKASEPQGNYAVNSRTSEGDTRSAQLLPQSLRAIAQVSNTYIVAEHPAGMWLVEQHIAHERVLYEELCDRWQLVPIEPPIVLEYLKTEQIEQLQRLGIEIEPFGEQMWAARTVPTLLAERDDRAAAIVELSQGGDLQAAQVATACRSAIRNGTPLTLSQMQTLLDRWQRTRNPRTCPHGRPIYLVLEETALARYFRRHWVIGKSHGI